MKLHNFFILEGKDLWGDYGAALLAGFAQRKGSERELYLQRTGPFVPPITFPLYSVEGRVPVVTDDLRVMLEGAGFPDISFRPVVLEHVVFLPWHLWDLSSEDPELYPPQPSPFSYINDFKHDTNTLSKMPKIWELVLPIVPMSIVQLQTIQGSFLDQFVASPTHDRYPPFFRTRIKYGYIVANSVVGDWLKQRTDEWVELRDVSVK